MSSDLTRFDQQTQAPSNGQEPQSEEAPPDWLFPRPVVELNAWLPEQTVEGMLYRGCRIALGGGPKSKKSWLLMQLCFCIANGLAFLEIPTAKGLSVYGNLELLEGDCRKRFFDIKAALGEGNLDNVEVIPLRAKGKLLNPIRLKQLTKILFEKKAVIAGFDPIYKLLNRRDENKATEVAEVLEPLEQMSEEGKICVGFCQHFAKGNQGLKYAIDRLAGSNVFSRDADVILTLTELSEADCFVVEVKQRSFAEVPAFGVRWQHPIFIRDDTVDITDIRAPGKKKETDEKTERMLSALRACDHEGGLSFGAWLSASGIAKTTFYNRLKSLMARKIVYQSEINQNYAFSPAYASKRSEYE